MPRHAHPVQGQVATPGDLDEQDRQGDRDTHTSIEYPVEQRVIGVVVGVLVADVVSCRVNGKTSEQLDCKLTGRSWRILVGDLVEPGELLVDIDIGIDCLRQQQGSGIEMAIDSAAPRGDKLSECPAGLLHIASVEPPTALCCGSSLRAVSPSYPYLEHDGVIAFAHRGGTSMWPENTMPSFQDSIDLGYLYLETDVHLSADGVLFAFHDHNLLRRTGVNANIADLDAREIDALLVDDRAPIPRLDEVLLTWPHARFNIDTKSDATVLPLIETVAPELLVMTVLQPPQPVVSLLRQTP